MQTFRLCISVLWHQFLPNLCSTPFSVILLSYEKSNVSIFLFTWLNIIDFPKQLQSLGNQALRLFGEYIFWSIRPGLKKGDLKNLAKFTGSTFAGSPFQYVAGWRPIFLLEEKLRHTCCPENFAKFSWIPILWNICERLVLCQKYKNERNALIHLQLQFLTTHYSLHSPSCL